ncbi:uncharacterized protein HMPREF1541_01762 [Cyphellophora europaea CBS 101466]|uniref:Serine carboxypeptidase S28 n=1 Tax=Cyphellophora europaea (strain CBS 101466) TaxID=1220924 RepID=W2S1Z9_CYPE1|nr:uncharacterized protein HMPREF1541_01762 [Cyphellophora europaea CBS 101466]ETN42605.1 hypothetical protein HMPREF1541_01762 [Cyphellophora europaea CBS 101466]
MLPGPVRLEPRQDAEPEDLYTAYNLSVPVDHFHNDSTYEPHSDDHFNLRYYFDATYYKPGGPVILLQSGETTVEDRLPYLQKGIVHQLTKATNGLGVILEHRYYGTSFPTPDLETKNLRFLTTQQAMADQAYFQQHVVFSGLEEYNLTAPHTPYIVYGGSYAGAFVAFMRVVYPDITWGAISSSGVTEAIYDYWQYYEPIRIYGPQDCISTQQKLMNVLDNILVANDTQTIQDLKSAFGLQNLTDNQDFANQISFGIQGWQSRNWDPEVNSPSFDEYCRNITSSELQWPATGELASNASALVEAGGWGNESDTLQNPMLNLIGWINDTYVSSCESTQNECFSMTNGTSKMYTDKSIENQDSLSWPYQYCTQWGYIQTGSGVPEGQLPLIPRILDLEYLTSVCRYAFNITTSPDLESVNQYGGFNISYPRLAIVGGETDPWRPASPLATLDVADRLNDSSTVDQPLILIEGAVHHWDENGLFSNETTPDLPPPAVANAQAEIAQFVQAWLMEWQQHCSESPEQC